MNANDKAMLEKVKPGWWVQYLNEGYAFNDQWYQVVDREPKYQWVWSPERGMAICPHIEALHALHAPTDDPQMATAYLMGEPETVTREEAKRMVRLKRATWIELGDTGIMYAAGEQWATAVVTTGGNVYKIKD